MVCAYILLWKSFVFCFYVIWTASRLYRARSDEFPFVNFVLCIEFIFAHVFVYVPHLQMWKLKNCDSAFSSTYCFLVVSRVFLASPRPSLMVWDVFEDRFIFTVHSAYLIFTISSVIRLYYFTFFISCGFFSCYNEFLWCICIYWFGCVKSIKSWKMLSPVVYLSVLSAVEVSKRNLLTLFKEFVLFDVR